MKIVGICAVITLVAVGCPVDSRAEIVGLTCKADGSRPANPDYAWLYSERFDIAIDTQTGKLQFVTGTEDAKHLPSYGRVLDATITSTEIAYYGIDLKNPATKGASKVTISRLTGDVVSIPPNGKSKKIGVCSRSSSTSFLQPAIAIGRPRKGITIMCSKPFPARLSIAGDANVVAIINEDTNKLETMTLVNENEYEVRLASPDPKGEVLINTYSGYLFAVDKGSLSPVGYPRKPSVVTCHQVPYLAVEIPRKF